MIVDRSYEDMNRINIKSGSPLSFPLASLGNHGSYNKRDNDLAERKTETLKSKK